MNIGTTTTPLAFSDYAWIWYTSVIENSKIAEGTKRNYRIIINDHLIPYFKETTLNLISSQQCQELLDTYIENSWSQGNKVRMTLKRIFEYAAEQKVITDNPAIDTTLPKTKSSERSCRKLRKSEVRLMYETYAETGEGLMFIFMYETGLRPIEVINQQWRNIDLQNGIMQISNPKNKKRKDEEIILTKFLLDELKAHKRYKRYVFNKLSDDKQHNEQSIKFAWKKFVRLMQNQSTKPISYDLSPILICRQKDK